MTPERAMAVCFQRTLGPFEEKTFVETLSVAFRGRRLVVPALVWTKKQKIWAFVIHLPWAIFRNLKCLLTGQFHNLGSWVPSPPGPPISIVNINVDKASQFASSAPVPAEVFDDVPFLSMDIAKTGVSVSITVRNDSSKPQVFNAAILGDVLTLD